MSASFTNGQPGYVPGTMLQPQGPPVGFVPAGQPPMSPPYPMPQPQIIAVPTGRPNMLPPIANCPVGLEYLTQVNQVIIEQLTSLETINTGLDNQQNRHHQHHRTETVRVGSNNFVIKNTMDQDMYFSRPDESCSCANKNDLFFYDNFERRVLMMDSPTLCGKGCFGCGDVILTVRDGYENELGKIHMIQKFLSTSANILSPQGELMYRITKGNILNTNRLDAMFHIRSRDNVMELGKITKLVTRNNLKIFDVTFPLDLEVRSKALLMASVFLLQLTVRNAS